MCEQKKSYFRLNGWLIEWLDCFVSVISQGGCLKSEIATVCCSQRPLHLSRHREAFYSHRPTQFIVSRDHNIFVVREAIYSHRPTHFIVAEDHNIIVVREAIYSHRPTQFIVAEDHNILVVREAGQSGQVIWSCEMGWSNSSYIYKWCATIGNLSLVVYLRDPLAKVDAHIK